MCHHVLHPRVLIDHITASHEAPDLMPPPPPRARAPLLAQEVPNMPDKQPVASAAPDLVGSTRATRRATVHCP